MKYFTYCRKSTDEEGKQILSLPSQRSELAKRVLHWPDVEIVGHFEEAMSAKKPGRPVFADLLRRVIAGEAQGIVAWDPDRLARNSIDGGKVIHMLDTGKLRDLKFATYAFENSPQGKFMLSIMFGNSKYFVDTLSINVKRGLVTKAENGWLPGLAPIGYLNNQETTFIDRDPERFDLVRRMWQLMLTGSYSIAQLHCIVNEEWGLRTVKRKKKGGGKLALSGVYRIFSNPFYAGVFVSGGRTWPGKHEPMISMAEFERVQRLLNRPSQARAKHMDFALTGILTCGECGFAVTAEEHNKPSGRHYTYYRCTKKGAARRCTQRYISERALDEAVEAFLSELQVPTSLLQWAADSLSQTATQTARNVEASKMSIERALAANARERGNLTTLRIRDLLSDKEFVERREALDLEQLRLEEELRHLDASRTWLEPFKRLDAFSSRAVEWYRRGDSHLKRLILSAAGSNPRLKDQKLLIEARKPLRRWSWPGRISERCSSVEDVRTLVATNDVDFKAQLDTIAEVFRLAKEQGLWDDSSTKAA